MVEKEGEPDRIIHIGVPVVAVGVVLLLAGGVGATTDESHTVTEQLSGESSAVEVYEHETESGDELHTIVLSPAAVDTPTDDEVLGIVVIPERGRVCRSVAGESYRSEDAGCSKDQPTVDAYLDAAGVERAADGTYGVA